MLLLWHADAKGRTWLGIQTIANKVGAGSLRTVRHALDALVRAGWLQSTPQTWASLTAEQTAAGRPVPRRGDVGQAPNLYLLLDGRGHPATSDVHPVILAPSIPKPGLARITTWIASPREHVQSPGQSDQGGQGQITQGEPTADLPVDPDPEGSRSRIQSVERASRVGASTPHVSNIREEREGWFEPWKILVDAHTEKTKSVYGLPPLPPDLKRDQRKALAESLDGAALEVCAKLRERTGTEHSVSDVRCELAGRVMQLYFKRDNEHLRRVKHALRDLPREFHARITEAMQALLRESHEAQQPRRPHVEPKFVETNKSIERPGLEQSPAAQMITAREARRLLDVLGGAPQREEPVVRPSFEPKKPIQDESARAETILLTSNDVHATRLPHTGRGCPYELRRIRAKVGMFAHEADGEPGLGPKTPNVQPGAWAKGAEGDPKPQMSNQGSFRPCRQTKELFVKPEFSDRYAFVLPLER